MDAVTWQRLMEALMNEAADYQPGNVLAPGGGSEGDSPIGNKYAELGPLAFVINEAIDATVTRGADRDELLDAIAQAAGEEIERADVDAVLAGENKCPDPALLQAFSSGTAIDYEIMLDAAQRGGCKNYGGTTTGIGSVPGY